jgi:glycosyltransferase involved in cell wall biosynthesis
MRIFIDGRVLNTQKFSGVSEYAGHIIEHLLEIDKKNDYILFINSFAKKISFDRWKKYANARLLDFHIPNRIFDLANYFLALPKIDRIAKADLFYSPHLNILSLTDPTRRILTIHDLSFIHFPEFFSWRGKIWHWRQSYKKQIFKTKKIIVDTDFTKADLVETFGLKPENIERIYPGVDPFYRPLFKEALNSFKKSRGFEKPFLFYLGVLEPRKNINLIIKAFDIVKKNRQFKDLELVIAGAKGWLYDTIFKEAGRSAFREDIRFLGQISKDEACYLYNSAALFVYPSFFEGFGFPPLEAQATGLPVVASNRSSLPEILGDSALLVDPWRTDELVYAIQELISSSTLRDTLKERGFKNVRRFSWLTAAKEVLNLFESNA